MNIVYIYGLVDPRTNQIRYVGKSVDPDKRLSQGHLLPSNLKQKLYKNHWLKELLSLNLSPEIAILESCNEANWEEREKYWIKFYREIIGDKLTNATEGGIGSSGHKQPHLNQQKSERTKNLWTGRKHREESKEKMRNAKIGSSASQETREKMSKAHKGHERYAKVYIVTFPDGHTEEVRNLTKFCREHNLSRQVMDDIVHGKSKAGIHRGFKASLQGS